VFEYGKIRPIWFERISQLASDRVMVKMVNQVWKSRDGDAILVSYAVTAAGNNYVLIFNSLDFTWTLQIVEESPFP